MANDRNTDELRAELCRELERIGVSEPEADRLSRLNFESRNLDADEVCQHVVPVSRGWVVIRDFPNRDVGLFATKEEALRDAHSSAAASGLTVRVHAEGK